MKLNTNIQTITSLLVAGLLIYAGFFLFQQPNMLKVIDSDYILLNTNLFILLASVIILAVLVTIIIGTYVLFIYIPSRAMDKIRVPLPEAHIIDLTDFAAYARDLQPAARDALEKGGYKFTNIRDDSWQKVAFTLYTDLCELNLKARWALWEDEEE